MIISAARGWREGDDVLALDRHPTRLDPQLGRGLLT